MIEVIINRLPNSKLSPNARVHWRTRHKEGNADMEEVIPIVWAAKEGIKDLPYKKAHISIEWVAKDRRKRDMDNLLSASKYFIDSLRHGGVILDDDAENVTYTLRYSVDKLSGPMTVITIRPED